MDSLLVDLDKVLDDLEAEENNDVSVKPPGHEIKPSGYEDYLDQHSEKPWKLLSEAPYHHGDTHHNLNSPQDKNTMNIMYDIPYEPTEKFDLSEADFAPSPTAGNKDYIGTSIYDFTKGTESVNSESVKLEENKNSQNDYDLSKSKSNAINSNFVKNDLQYGTYKLPVQAADLSPEKVQIFQMNGHATDSDLYQPKQENVASRKEEPVIQPLTLSSFSSSTSNRTVSDTDKAPIQCNTPSTPYENVYINPFDSQLKIRTSEIPEASQSFDVQKSGSSKSSHSSSHADINLDMENQILIQNQSLSNSDPFLNSYSSLPIGDSLPNPARQFHSLPATLGLQTQAQRSNKNTQIETVEEVSKYVEDAVSDESSDTKLNDQAGDESGHDTCKHKTDDIRESEMKETQVCSFNDDVELSEKDLDDYLGDEETDNLTKESEMNVEVIPDQSVSASVWQSVNVQLLSFDPLNKKETEDSKQEVTGFNLSDKENFSVESSNIPDITEAVDSESKESDILENNKIPTDQVVEIKQDAVADEGVFFDKQPGDLDSQVGVKYAGAELVVSKLPSEDQDLIENSRLVSDSMKSAQKSVIPAPETETWTADNSAVFSDDSYMPSGTIVDSLDVDLTGPSAVNVSSGSPFVVREENRRDLSHIVNDDQGFMSAQRELNILSGELANTTRENEGRQLMDSQGIQNPGGTDNLVSVNHDAEEQVERHPTDDPALEEETVELRQTQLQMGQNGSSVRPQSWGPSETGQSQVLKQKRPTSLNLSPRPEFNPQNGRSPDQSPEETGASGENVQDDYTDEELSGAVAGAEGPSLPVHHPPFDPEPPPPYSSTLGRVAPKWVPDAEAPACMNCDARFTFTKRRHHCRACGKVFCSQCCSMKNRLAHMENKEGRVCFQCHQLLVHAEHWYEASGAGRTPHPNNPNDYCSTVPPTQQAASSMSPPSVMVPVAGVLKRDGGNRRNAEPKQVMFSDGIRPGGDLTELDGSAEVTRMPPRRSRVQKKVERHSQGYVLPGKQCRFMAESSRSLTGEQSPEDGHHSPRNRRLRTVEDRTSRCLIPEEGLPPLVLSAEPGAECCFGIQQTSENIPDEELKTNNLKCFSLMPNPQPDDFMQQVKDEEARPVIFAITPNLHVLVKIINLDCCVNHVVWCFTTQGMCTVGQEEIVTALEVSPDEATVPRDIFTHLYTVYEEASKGNVVTEMGHTIFNQSFLGSRDHGGFLYVRATFQCVQKFILPQPPYLFAILLQKWETPWAKVFPIRLMLRLGAEYRYYPCPLIGVRNRKPVYFEIGHTIMNLLADFRNYQYMLPQISGITIHMEDKVTRINFPRNRYDELMKVVNNSNEHVMAMGATFSVEADSHLVCIQNDDGNYQTQAINIQNKPRKVTGASFVVFNGALKSSSGMSAKSSIVEDGLMVQITPDSMLALKQAMKDMQNYTISCGTISTPKPDEMVKVQWVDDDKNVNVGVKSPVDNMAMDGINSLHIYNSPDYAGENQIIRWTEVFFIQNDDSGSVKWDPIDLSRLGETLATACCMALIPHLGKLKEAALTKIGLRVTIKPDMVGYEAGACGERLPDIYMNDLDNELIPVMHRATQQNHVGTVLELIFQILN